MNSARRAQETICLKGTENHEVSTICCQGLFPHCKAACDA